MTSLDGAFVVRCWQGQEILLVSKSAQIGSDAHPVSDRVPAAVPSRIKRPGLKAYRHPTLRLGMNEWVLHPTLLRNVVHNLEHSQCRFYRERLVTPEVTHHT